MSTLFPKTELTKWDYLAILVCSVPAFYMLGAAAIHIWDEAVYANASLDMVNGNSWIVPVQAEYNTKPPLVLWLQAVTLKILPWPEFAVRLPSALSVTGILFLLTAGLKRWSFHQWARILVMVAFVGNEGFIRQHISRTGDLDAVMTFFSTGYVMVVLDAIHFKRWSAKHSLYFFIFLICAFYSKSIAGWLMLGPLGMVWLLSPIRNVLLNIKFWFGTFASLGICLLYYVIRESIQPGYMALTWNSEYMRMFANVMHWHDQPFNYYFKNFVALHFYTPWIYILIACVLYALFMIKQIFISEHLLRWIIIALGYLLLISIPSVKLEWYDALVYPFFALILGIVLSHVTWKMPATLKYLMFVPIALILYSKIAFIKKDNAPRHEFEYEGYMLRQTNVDEKTKVFMPIEHPAHRLQLDFYRQLKWMTTGEEIEVLENADQLEVGERVIVRNGNMAQLESVIQMDTIKTYEGLGFEIGVISVK